MEVPTYSHTVEVNAVPATIFTILEDVGRTPEFHQRCTRLEKVDPGPLAVGQRLIYHYRDGRRSGVMDGDVEAYEPGRHLTFRFSDTMTDVTVALHAEPLGHGRTTLTHTVSVRAKGIASLLSPLITLQLRRLTPSDLSRLKGLAEES